MAALGAIAGISQIGSAGMDMAMPFIQQQWSQSASARQRHWEEMMFDTRYQRTVADMKAAGLNPILAATGGNVGGGLSASAIPGASGGSRRDFGDAIRKGISTAKQAKILDAQVGTAEAGRDRAVAEATSAKNAAVQSDMVNQYWPTMMMDMKSTEWENMKRAVQLREIERDTATAGLFRTKLENRIRQWDLVPAEVRGRYDLDAAGQKGLQMHRFFENLNPFLSGAKGALQYRSSDYGE